MNRKPRKEEIYIGHQEKFSSARTDNHGNTMIRTDSGEWIRPDSVFTQTTRERDSGKNKVLNRVPDIAIGIWERELSTEYDAVWAIDTNTKNIEGDNISVAAIVEAYFDSEDSGKKIILRWRISGTILFKNAPKGDEEKVGWCKLIGRVMKDEQYDIDQQIAIITDHDLGAHNLINKHEVPILDGTNSYLPRNFTLIYASTDSGTENCLNWLLEKCEKEAERILRLLEKEGYCEWNGERIYKNNIPMFDIKKYKGKQNIIG